MPIRRWRCVVGSARIDPRAKGARFERHIARLISEAVGERVERNLGQSRRSGTDLTSAPGGGSRLDQWAIECKHCKVLRVPSWWRQAARNARPSQKPVLVYKPPNKSPVWVFRLVDLVQVNSPRLSTSETRVVDDITLVEMGTEDALSVLKLE